MHAGRLHEPGRGAAVGVDGRRCRGHREHLQKDRAGHHASHHDALTVEDVQLLLGAISFDAIMTLIEALLSNDKKTILINPTDDDSIYIIFGSRWKQSPLLPVYALISHNGKYQIDIESFPALSREILKEAITLNSYLDEQTWHQKKKKKKKKVMTKIKQ